MTAISKRRMAARGGGRGEGHLSGQSAYATRHVLSSQRLQPAINNLRDGKGRRSRASRVIAFPRV